MFAKPFIKLLIFLFAVVYSLPSISQFCYKKPLSGNNNSVLKTTVPFDTIKHKKKKNDNGLLFGANLGIYRANRYSAQYYNGSQHYNNNPKNVIESTIFDFPQNYENIKQKLNVPDFSVSELPAKMNYSYSFMFGIFFKYCIKNSGIFAQFNFAKLTAKDVFTISVKDPLNPDIPKYMPESVYGSEQRTNIDIGYYHTFSPDESTRPYMELGVNINNTKFLYNRINIEGLEYSIADPFAAYHILNQGGIGYGGFAGAGVELVFKESISVNPGFDLYYSKTKLGYENSDGYTNTNAYFNKYKLHYCIFVRTILNGLF